VPVRAPVSAPALMIGASLLFAVMGVCVKLASAQYGAGEIVLYRALVGLVLMSVVVRTRGIGFRTQVPGMHFWRSLSGSTALCCWFYAIGGLPLATAMTLNYMSSVWIALFLVGGAVLMPVDGKAQRTESRVDGRLVAAVLAGFVGVALVLRPTIDQQQVWHGLIGLGSGMIAAMAYLQVTALGRMGEPEARVVLYFSLSGVLMGAGFAVLTGGFHAHTLRGALLLLAIGTLATGAQWMITRAYGTGATLGIAALQYLGIVFSFAFGMLIFDEQLTALAAAGITLIIAAGVTATLLRDRPRAPSDTLTPTES
jgi:S-adenosylmethionine uptake transporter